MEQKEIYKVLYKKPIYGVSETSCYGICLDENRMLLEDLSFIFIKEQAISTPILRMFNPENFPRIASTLRSGSFSYENLGIIALKTPHILNNLSTLEINADKNVPDKFDKPYRSAKRVVQHCNAQCYQQQYFNIIHLFRTLPPFLPECSVAFQRPAVP